MGMAIGTALGGARAQAALNQARIEQQFRAACIQTEAMRRDMERLMRAAPGPKTIDTTATVLRTPEREPVPSLCNLTGRWL